MNINSEAGYLIVCAYDDVKSQLDIDMLMGDYVAWSFMDPDDNKEMHISTYASATEYVAFCDYLAESVRKIKVGLAVLVYREDFTNKVYEAMAVIAG